MCGETLGGSVGDSQISRNTNNTKGSRSASSYWATSLAVLVAASLGIACAPKQVIPLDVAPDAVTVFLDGEALAGTPSQLELRSDRDHKLYFKRAGYRPEMVVLRSTENGSQPGLEPTEIRVRLAPLTGPARKDLVIELED